MFPREVLQWQVGFCEGPGDEPAEWVPAQVPGAVQLDWARAKDLPDHNFGDNWRQYQWMEDKYWLYRARLDFKPLGAGERLYFICGGVDYHCLVRLGGEVLAEQEGMFTPIEVDLTGRARPGDVLEVLVFPAPKSVPEPSDRDQANQCCKPAVSYGWDFHPRLIPLGIWQEALLERRPARHIRSAEVSYELGDDLSRADLTLRVEFSTAGSGTLRWRLQDPDGHCVIERQVAAAAPSAALEAELTSPRLWWPNGQGEPALYEWVTELLDAQGRIVDSRRSRVGLRRVRLVVHEGGWVKPDRFPKSRSNPPITMEINGRRIFCKGSNWVSPDIFPALVSEATCRSQLTAVRDAHMNLLRCWGGAIVQKEAFFDLCDELGIMVWQEFPLSCNRYDGNPDYLRILDSESKSIIRRLRPHASVVLWCGGNELFNVWSGMTDQDLALRLLNRNCYDLDPQRPFLPTSPVMGMGHGGYGFVSGGEEVFQMFARADCTAYTEFGCWSLASVEVLKEVLPAGDLYPVPQGAQMETHRAAAVWGPGGVRRDLVEEYFGPSETLVQLVDRTQFLQGEGLKCIFEEARRQKPTCAMALNWVLNEPWPTVLNGSLFSWPARSKPALAEVARACRPVLASARIERMRWKEGDLFCPELWLLNDSPQDLPAGRVEALLEIGGREHFLLGWDHGPVEANRNLPGPVLRFRLPHAQAERMVLHLRAAGAAGRDSHYTLLYKPVEAPAAARGARRLNQ